MMISKPGAGAVAALLFVAGLSGPVLAASEHAHGQNGAVPTMSLDHGQKWTTDEALRSGMADIRAAIASALPRVHAGELSPQEAAALADRVQEQIDYVVANCKLPEESDLQLHIVLTRMLDGVEMLRKGPKRHDGVLAIVDGLNGYGARFDHPGWQPVL